MQQQKQKKQKTDKEAAEKAEDTKRQHEDYFNAQKIEKALTAKFHKDPFQVLGVPYTATEQEVRLTRR